jgi:hypothetical protein
VTAEIAEMEVGGVRRVRSALRVVGALVSIAGAVVLYEVFKMGIPNWVYLGGLTLAYLLTVLAKRKAPRPPSPWVRALAVLPFLTFPVSAAIAFGDLILFVIYY